MQDFAQPMVQDAPLVWFLFNMAFWAVMVYGINRAVKYRAFRDRGRMQCKVSVMQKVRPNRFNLLLASRSTSLEDRQAYGENHIIRATWDEEPKEWSGASLSVTVEYDIETAFLHYVYISYNKREAKKDESLSLRDVRNRIAEDFQRAGVFEDGAYSFVDNSEELDEEQLRALAAEMDDDSLEEAEAEAAAAAGRMGQGSGGSEANEATASGE